MKHRWYSSLFKRHYNVMHVGIVLLVGLSFCMFFLLVREYRQLHKATIQLCELKEEYRVYTMALKKMVDQESATQENGAIKDEKKKMKSSYNEVSVERPFISVNREDEYLLEQALILAKEHDLGEAVSLLLDEFEWKKRVMPVMKKKKIRQKRIVTEQFHFSGTTDSKKIDKKNKEERYSDAHFIWPIDRSSFWLSSLFGPRKLKNKDWKFHSGIDMAAVKGTPVRAAASGIVVDSYHSAGYGNCIVIVHNKKYKTRYAHLQARKVKAGQKVKEHDIIGTVGDTGHVRKSGKDASHLHFEVLAYGKQINPLAVLE